MSDKSRSLIAFLEALDLFIVQCEDIAADADGTNQEVAGLYRRAGWEGAEFYSLAETLTRIQ